MPGQFDLASGISLAGDTTQNLTLPNPSLVNVSVTDTTGHPVPGATVGEAAADPTAPFALFSGATAQPGTQSATPQTTDANGRATLCLYPAPAAHLTAASGARQGTAVTGTSTGTATIEIPTLPSVSLSSSLPASQFAQPVTITATAGPNGSGGPVPGGTVTFSVDGTPQSPVALSSGQASTSAALTQVVNPAATSASLSTTSTPSVYGQSGSVTVKVQPNPPGTGTPTGTVTFTVDGTAGQPVPLSAGKAAMPLAGLAAGSHQITAAYSGDANYLGDTSSALSQVVNQAATTTKLTSAANPVQQGAAGAITAAVKDVLPATGVATGTITFTVDGVARPPVALSAGVARLRLASLTAGSHMITAAYSGDANHVASTSAPLTEVVTAAAPLIHPLTGAGAWFMPRR